MMPFSDVTFTPSMTAETSSDAITCASERSRRGARIAEPWSLEIDS
jgi:hypothetical protein